MPQLTPLRTVILLATAMQCANYILLGAFEIRWAPGWLFTLCCFCVVEAYFAIKHDRFMWLFVALNAIGIVSFLWGGA